MAIIVLNKFEPLPPGYIEVDTTSYSPRRDLSPFYLGPVMWGTPSTGAMRCERFENLWQFSKVYPQHASLLPGRNPNDPFNYEPTKAFFDWQRAGFSDFRAHRYPMGKGARPLYSFHMGQKMDYIEARKQLYIPYYTALVCQTASFREIQKLVMAGHNIALRDFDGYNHTALGMSMVDVINNPRRPMGHAFVLKMALS